MRYIRKKEKIEQLSSDERERRLCDYISILLFAKNFTHSSLNLHAKHTLCEYFIFHLFFYNSPILKTNHIMLLGKTGIHIIGDLYECSFEDFATITREGIINIFGSMIDDEWLNRLGEHIHLFWWASFTAVFALAESHVSIHTWPEFGYVSIDVFVCNQSQDNSSKAENLYKKLIEIFQSQEQKLQTIHRSMIAHK